MKHELLAQSIVANKYHKSFAENILMEFVQHLTNNNNNNNCT